MLYRYSFIIPFLAIFLQTISAQQLPIFSQYRENHSLLNPAIVHSDFIALSYKPQNTAGITYRHQWAQIEDAPKTFTARYEHVFDKNNFLIGGALIRDETGPISHTGGYARYAYLLKFSRKTFFSIGTALGVQQYSYDAGKGVLLQANDDLGELSVSSAYLDTSIGGYFQAELENGNKIYGGLSVLQLVNVPVGNNQEDKINRQPQINLNGGFYHYLSDGFGNWLGELFLEPSIWLKYTPNVPLQIDTNLRFQMAGVFFVGFGYSFSTYDQSSINNILGNNIIFEGGLTFGEDIGFDYAQFRIGYSFGRTVATYGSNLGYIHEINLTYAWEN